MLIAPGVPTPVASAPRLRDDYAELKARIRDAGLLGRQRWFYALLGAADVAALVICFACLWRFHHLWVQALAGVGLGLVSAQLGFMLHDAGHHQVFERARWNRLLAFVTANGLIGMSAGWWVSEHTAHHANPNLVDVDPDLDNIALSYTVEQAQSRRGLFRFVARHQAVLLVPLTSFVAWNMHAGSLRYLYRRGLRRAWPEWATLAVHAVVYLGLLVALVGPWSALLVVVIHKAISGMYLASVVATNHHGMPKVDARLRSDFLRRQVLTSRNVRTGWAGDLWYGTLNLQIEHHLFPRMTRLNLRRARPIVMAYCADRDIPYHETSPLRAYVELFRFLHAVSEPVRARTPAPAEL